MKAIDLISGARRRNAVWFCAALAVVTVLAAGIAEAYRTSSSTCQGNVPCKCQFSDGTYSNGPCVEVRNDRGGSRVGDTEMNLWCSSGDPTGAKVILRPNPADSYTCAGRTVKVQRTQAGCNTCTYTSTCGNNANGKMTVSLRWISHNNEQFQTSCQ